VKDFYRDQSIVRMVAREQDRCHSAAPQLTLDCVAWREFFLNAVGEAGDGQYCCLKIANAVRLSVLAS
jgi:hypothetical protein